VTYFAAVFVDQAKFSFKRKITGVLLVGFMLLMCTPSCKKEEKPPSILSEKEMVRVMVEIYLVEEKVNRLGVNRDSVEKIFPKFREKVFNKVHVKDSVFIKSMDYYMAHPEKLEHIYATLVDTLSFRAQAAVIVDSASKKK
jgi:hypothetical protein